jgi:hypothetical protein
MQNAQFENEVLRLTNEFRQKNGRDPLTIDLNLEAAADLHTQNMAQQDFFSHTGKDGSTPSTRTSDAGYESGFVGENISAGYNTPQQVVDGWINSAGHRANMLNADYNEIGIGYYYLQNDAGSVNYYHYWTQVFGKGTIDPPPQATEPPTTSIEDPPTSSIPETPTPDPSAPPSEEQSLVNLRGSRKSDQMVGNGEDNWVKGLRGNDKLFGRAGNDQMAGGKGRDRLSGGTGDDIIKGGQGRDVIRGGHGNNRVTGNAGRDRFVLRPGAGLSVITDFKVSKDQLRIAKTVSIGTLQIRQQGDDAVILAKNDVLALVKDVAASNITSDIFA